MDFARYKDGGDLLRQTGWSIEKALDVVDAELKKLQNG